MSNLYMNKNRAFMFKPAELPILKSVWRKIRQQKILRNHRKVANFWSPVIVDYFADRLPYYSFEKQKDLGTDHIIWQYWGQGIERNKLPEVVKICFDSVEKWKGDYIIIRLSDATVKEYVDLPDFVWDKVDSGIFNRTFFSDLLRLALLGTYGGIWMDATILLTDSVPETFSKQAYFMFQRDPDEKYKSRWTNSYAYYWGWNDKFKVRVLNSVIFAKKGNVLILALYDLLLHYWKTKNDVIDYFFFQILYNELVSDKLTSQKCDVVSDVLPHLLQTKINGQLNDVSFDEVFIKTSIHKLTYFDERGIEKLRRVLHINGMS